MSEKTKNFPVGSSISTKAFHADPYAIYAQLLAKEPITWVEELGMYLVVGYTQVQSILMDSDHFSTGTDHSTIFDTFGNHMLTVEGTDHERYKGSVRSSFMPKNIRLQMERVIEKHVDTLIGSFAAKGCVELRSAFASRLPVLTILSLFGLPLEDEQHLRRWYNSFEEALANFTWDDKVRANAHQNVTEFHTYLQKHIDKVRNKPDGSLLDIMVHAQDRTSNTRLLTDSEVKRNASIIFFGGISTVEALLLNCLYALSVHTETFVRVRQNHALIPKVIEETLRWATPVQSATRHVTGRVTIGDVTFKEGDTVNCMIAAANRDTLVFTEPDTFDIDRPRLNRHLAFAYGPHHCLGSHLARAEARIALEKLFSRLVNCRMDPANPSKPVGYEFHQPREFSLIWDLPQQ